MIWPSTDRLKITIRTQRSRVWAPASVTRLSELIEAFSISERNFARWRGQGEFTGKHTPSLTIREADGIGIDELRCWGGAVIPSRALGVCGATIVEHYEERLKD